MNPRVLRPVLVIALLSVVMGLVLGPVGAALMGRDPFLNVPEVHLAPQPVFCIGGAVTAHGCDAGFAVTNTLLSAWLTTVVILALFVGGTRVMAPVPGRLQGLLEMLVEGLYGFIVSVAGEQFGRRFFPILATIFVFVSFNAWMALLPIYPTVGFKADGAGHVTTHLLRSAGTDVNMPLALALVSFVFIEGWGFRAHGVGYLREFFRSGGINTFIGILELFSHFIRLLSFTFRLFGNMIAGEIVLFMVTFLLVFTVPLAFYALELLVGGLQALIFMALTLVFAIMATAPHEGAHEEHATAPAHAHAAA